MLHVVTETFCFSATRVKIRQSRREMVVVGQSNDRQNVVTPPGSQQVVFVHYNYKTRTARGTLGEGLFVSSPSIVNLTVCILPLHRELQDEDRAGHPLGSSFRR